MWGTPTQASILRPATDNRHLRSVFCAQMGPTGFIPSGLATKGWPRLSRVPIPALVLWGSAVVLSATPQKPPPIRGEGCVESGVEARCLVVKDIKNGTQYNLFVKGIQPAIGSGIEFSGTPHRGMTTCVQGTAVDVVSWVRKDLKCTDGTAPKPK